MAAVTTTPAGPPARSRTRASAKPVRLHSLTAIRWIAALGIFTYHMRFAMYDGGLGWLGDLFVPFRNGVSLFFVLSGFVLAWSARPGDTARRFYRRRAARIYPVYLAALGIGILLTFVESHWVHPGRVAATATLTQSWVPNEHVFHALNAPGWSLSVETFFYALFPFFLPAIAGLSSRGRRTLLAGAVAFSVLTGSVASVHLLGGASYWATTVLPAARLPEFLAGAAVAVEAREGRWPRLRLRTAVAITLAALAAVYGAYLLWGTAGNNATTVSATLVPFMLLVALLARWDVEAAGSSRWSRWWVRWGDRSYAFYLVHYSVIRIYELAHPGPVSGAPEVAAVYAVTLAGSMVAAVALHDGLERPLERRLRGEAPRRPVPDQEPYPPQPVSGALPARAGR